MAFRPVPIPEERAGVACIFCEILDTRSREILAENEYFIVVFDNFPVNKGHALLIPKRHISTPFDISRDEAVRLVEILQTTKENLDERFQPDGYNIGINVGAAAGQTIPHLHIHLIPRYVGDVENPRGGIRNLKQALVPY
jgi:diadenosine tetraphosphate (Ap4A) HIT family hydrolase